MMFHRGTTASLVLAALALAGSAAGAQEPRDDEDKVWAGDDDIWTGQQDTDAESNEGYAAEPTEAEAVPPPDEPASPAPDGIQGSGGDSDFGDVARTAPRYQDFQEGLASHGQWVDTPEYGRVWRPGNVDPDWRPYLHGRWAYTSFGWTWVADEPFGWAVYHYGRWWHSPAFGWAWVPGRVWAPAWVAWRWGGGACGWAPLGPRGVVYVEPTRWVFVRSIHFASPIRTYALPQDRAHAIWTRVAPLPLRRPGRYAGPPVAGVSRAVGRTILPTPIRRARQAGVSRGGSTVEIYRPRGVPMRRWREETRPYRRAEPQRPWPQRPEPQRREERRPEPRPRAEQPRRPIWFGGVPSPGVIERNKRRVEERRKSEERPPQKPKAKEPKPKDESKK